MHSTRKRRGFILGLCAALTVASSASGGDKAVPAPAAGAAKPLPSGTVGENMVTATATVKKLDLQSRMVTLERADGSRVTFRVHDDVRNLPQVKVGDEVTATYYESLAFAVRRPGE